MFTFDTEVIMATLGRNDLKHDARRRVHNLILMSKPQINSWAPVIDAVKSLQSHEQAKELTDYPEQLETLDDICLANIIGHARTEKWDTKFSEEIPIGLFAVCFILGKPPEFEETVNSMRKRVRGITIDYSFRKEIERGIRANNIVQKDHGDLKTILNDPARRKVMVDDNILYDVEQEINFAGTTATT